MLRPLPILMWVVTFVLLLALTRFLFDLTAPLWGEVTSSLWFPGPPSLWAQFKWKLVHMGLLFLSPTILGLTLLVHMQLTRRVVAHRSAHLQLTRLTAPQLFCAIAVPLMIGMLCAVTLTEIIVVLLGWKVGVGLGAGRVIPGAFTLGQVPISWLDRHWADQLPDEFTLELALVVVPVMILARSFLPRNRTQVAPVIHSYVFLVLVAHGIMAMRIWAPLYFHTIATPDDLPWPDIGEAPYFSIWGYIIAALIGVFLCVLAAPRFRRLLDEE